jgi:hypothetical protein
MCPTSVWLKSISDQTRNYSKLFYDVSDVLSTELLLNILMVYCDLIFFMTNISVMQDHITLYNGVTGKVKISMNCTLEITESPSGVPNNYKTLCFGNWIYLHPQVKGRRHLLCWVPLKVMVQWLRLALSKGPNRVGVFLPSLEEGNRSECMCTETKAL